MMRLILLFVLGTCIAAGCAPPRDSRTAAAPSAPVSPAPARLSSASPPPTPLVAAAASPQPNPTQPPQVAELERRVADLEQRVRNLEQQGIASWSCQARCGTYHDEKEHFSVLTATGESAAEAMDKLIAKCSNVLYTSVQRTDQGSSIRIELVPPTIKDSCTRN